LSCVLGRFLLQQHFEYVVHRTNLWQVAGTCRALLVLMCWRLDSARASSSGTVGRRAAETSRALLVLMRWCLDSARALLVYHALMPRA